MNYNSIEEILSAGITNMTVLRDNTKLSPGEDIIDGVSWFEFNGAVASTIYVDSYSNIGFGSSAAHLNVNSRTSALWSLYREEGTLYNYYKFLKIRWSGYSRSTSTSASYRMEYDVILWSTGDISLHIISVPTSSSYNNGTYSLVASSTYTYTVSTSSPDVTFKKTDSGFEVQNSIISLEYPSDRRYLARDGSTIYSLTNNVLTSLGSVELTSALFLESGYDPIVNGVLDLSVLSGLSNPELLYWQEITDDATKLIIEGTPTLPQTVLYNSETIPSDSAIEAIEAVSTDDALFTITFDGGIIWNYYDGSAWVVAESTSNGMSHKTLKAVTKDNWAEVMTSDMYQIRCALPAASSAVYKLAVKYV